MLLNILFLIGLAIARDDRLLARKSARKVQDKLPINIGFIYVLYMFNKCFVILRVLSERGSFTDSIHIQHVIPGLPHDFLADRTPERWQHQSLKSGANEFNPAELWYVRVLIRLL